MRIIRGIIVAVLICLAAVDAISQNQLGGGRIPTGGMGNGMGSNNKQNNTQDEDREVVKEPVLIVVKDQGIAFGIDIAPFIIRIINEERTGFAFVGRYGIKNRLWAGAEAGFENVKYDKEDYSYKSNGTFVRLGIDYDIYVSDEYPTNNNIFVGARYGYAWQNHQSDKFVIVDDYWGAFEGSVGKTPVNTHWLEGLFGLRCEMLPNVYMSWSFRGKVRLASTHSADLNPYTIAGLGKYDTRVVMGFTYTVEYQIPTNRRKKR
ncbi:MAG: PorT family protein [Bacteroidales bacterium]|nr:PorT family protein [Bacteroidales bacterium]